MAPALGAGACAGGQLTAVDTAVLNPGALDQ